MILPRVVRTLDLAVFDIEPGHFAILDDIHAAGAAPRVAPSHSVMSRDAGAL